MNNTTGAVHAIKKQLNRLSISATTSTDNKPTTTTGTSKGGDAAPRAAATATAPKGGGAEVWKAREIQRLGQLPLETDDAAPAQVEACITALNERVEGLAGDEDVALSAVEAKILREIQRCEGPG